MKIASRLLQLNNTTAKDYMSLVKAYVDSLYIEDDHEVDQGPSKYGDLTTDH